MNLTPLELSYRVRGEQMMQKPFAPFTPLNDANDELANQLGAAIGLLTPLGKSWIYLISALRLQSYIRQTKPEAIGEGISIINRIQVGIFEILHRPVCDTLAEADALEQEIYAFAEEYCGEQKELDDELPSLLFNSLKSFSLKDNPCADDQYLVQTCYSVYVRYAGRRIFGVGSPGNVQPDFTALFYEAVFADATVSYHIDCLKSDIKFFSDKTQPISDLVRKRITKIKRTEKDEYLVIIADEKHV
jgi:hypothetical protein